MSKSSTMVLAVGAGYLLGRKHKLRRAALLAAAAATGSAGGMAGRALRGGGKLLASPQVLDKLPPEAAKLAGLVRSDLAQAGKAAAQAAVSNRVDSLTSALYDRAEAVRGGGAADDTAGHDLAEDENRPGGEHGEPDDEEPLARPKPRPGRRPAGAGPRSSGRSGERDKDDDRDGRSDRGRKARARAGSAPVRRTGR